MLDLRIQPRASRDEFAGPHGNRFRIRITAPPVDGKANNHLLRFLADSFGVPVRQVELMAGQTGRDKRVRIETPHKLPPELGITGRP